MIHSTRCRATDREQGPPCYSQNWALSIKDQLKITDNQIFCGPWIINFSDVVSAHLYSVKTFFNLPYCKLLEIRTEHNCFQFGLNPWSKIYQHIPVSYSESECRMIGKPYSSCTKKQKLYFLFAGIFLILLSLKLL